jgi:hypothetical protein
MRVQLIKRPTHKVKYLVVRVLTYNNEEIDLPISEEDINKFATLRTSTKSIKKGLDLFSFEYGQLRDIHE